MPQIHTIRDLDDNEMAALEAAVSVYEGVLLKQRSGDSGGLAQYALGRLGKVRERIRAAREEAWTATLERARVFHGTSTD